MFLRLRTTLFALHLKRDEISSALPALTVFPGWVVRILGICRLRLTTRFLYQRSLISLVWRFSRFWRISDPALRECANGRKGGISGTSSLPLHDRIQWTPDSSDVALADVGVNLGRLRVRVPQEFLDVSQVGPSFQQMGGKRMTQRVRCGVFPNIGPTGDEVRIGHNLPAASSRSATSSSPSLKSVSLVGTPVPASQPCCSL